VSIGALPRKEEDVEKRKERGLKQLPDGRWQFSWCHEGKYHRHIVPTEREARTYLESIRTRIREARFLGEREEV
jgi:hypothetical protein